MTTQTISAHVKGVTPGRGISVRDAAIVVTAYTVALLVIAGFPHARIGFPLDDSWIHQVVARNLAQYGTLGFIPGVWSSGSSSVLWTLILAANWKFLPGISPVIYSGMVSVLLLAGVGLGLLGMARRDGLPEGMCWLWALTPALDGNFLWLGMIGMEHLLFVTLSVVGTLLWFQQSTRSALGSALCLGALSMTRPEGVVLAMMAILAARWAGRARRDIGILGGVVALCVLASFASNFVTSHSWLPTTYAGRKWLYFGSDKVPPLLHLTFPYVLFQSLLQPWAVHQTRPLYAINALIALLMAVGMWQVFSERRKRMGFLLLWSLVHIGIYAAMLPTRSHGGRYQPLFLALSFPLMFLGLDDMVRRTLLSGHGTARMRRAAGAGTVLACILCGVFSLAAWRTVTRTGISLIELTHARMGRFLVDSLPSGSKVAALDIGRMGFIFGGKLGDMGGLTDNAFLPYMRDHRAFDYLQQRGVQYLVWPTNEEGVFDIPQILSFTDQNKRDLTSLARFCAPHDLWYTSYSVTLDAAPCQTLFRLRLPKAER